MVSAAWNLFKMLSFKYSQEQNRCLHHFKIFYRKVKSQNVLFSSELFYIARTFKVIIQEEET
jgi:hypothetical protein